MFRFFSLMAPSSQELEPPANPGRFSAILVLSLVMGATLVLRTDLELAVVRDHAPVAVRLSDGRIRNAYAVTLTNKSLEEREFSFAFEGLPGGEITVIGGEENGRVLVAPGARRTVRLLATAALEGRTDIIVVATDTATGARAHAADLFVPLPMSR